VGTRLGIIVSKVLGWAKADDKKSVLLGIQQSDGTEIVLAFEEPMLMDAITSLIAARAAFQPGRGADMIDEIAVETDWFDFGISDETGKHFVRFRLNNGGHMSFLMDKTMAARLIEVMNVAVLGANVPTPSGPKN
jgi:hypothetical protein